MNKMNKKGFTLIEMLVVIAIIAVLVSIIVPTVSSSTDKAKAATDAANLRSILAEANADYMAGVTDANGFVKVTFNDDGTIKFEPTDAAPTSKVIGGTTGTAATIGIHPTTKNLSAQYGDYSIDDLSEMASTGKAPDTLTGVELVTTYDPDATEGGD